MASSAIGEPCDRWMSTNLRLTWAMQATSRIAPDAIEVLEPGIAVGMHPAAEAGEVILGVLAFAVAGEPIPGCGRGIPAPGAFVAGIGPEPCRLGLAGAGGQHAARACRRRRSPRPTGHGGRWHRPGVPAGRWILPDPIGQGRAVEVETFAVEDLALAIERQVIGIFADQHMGQQARPWAAALDRARRQRRLDEAFAAGAGQPGPDDPVHDEAAGDILQFLGDVLADPAQAPAAVGTGVRRRASVPPPSAGYGPGSDGASVCPSPRCPAASSAPSSRRRRSRWSPGPVAAVRRSRTTRRTGAPGARPAGGAASRSGSPAPSPRPEAAR